MKSVLLLLLALLAAHGMTAFRYAWEDVGGLEALRLVNPDLVGVTAVGVGAVLWWGNRAWIRHGMALALLLVPLYRFAESIMPPFYGKPFDLYEDASMVHGLVHLLTQQYPVWINVAQGLGTLLAVASVFVLAHLVVRPIAQAGTRPRLGMGLLGCCVGGFVLALAEGPPAAGVPRWFGPSMYRELYGDLARIPESRRTRQRFQEDLEHTQQVLATVPGDLGRLAGADVYVIFLESYGRALLDAPETARRFDEWSAVLEDKLERAGFHAVSAFLYPSIQGGNSSLAHAEFLTGVKVPTRHCFEDLLQSPLRAMPRFFTEAGYHTVNVQPAMPIEWPDGRFYGFGKDVFQFALPYQGITYHWGMMPDQFAMNHVLETEIRPSTQPVFLQYVSVTSHAPYHMIPPYYEDWSRCADPTAFDGPPEVEYAIDWTNYVGHPEVEQAYVDSIHYSLRTTVGLAEQLERPSLIFVLGDHQPPVVGDLMRHNPSADVPFHVLSNVDQHLLPFASLGFSVGLRPRAGAPQVSSSAFLPAFLRMFAEPQ